MSDMPKAYRDLIEPLIGTTREIFAAGATLAPIALVGNIATRDMRLVTMDPHSADPKNDLVSAIRTVAKHQEADFIFTVMDAWALDPAQAHRYEEIIERYGSIGQSPYRIDIVSFSIETHWGVWMAQAPLEMREGGSRTFAEPDFRRYPEAAGRFGGLLPAKDGEDTATVLH